MFAVARFRSCCGANPACVQSGLAHQLIRSKFLYSSDYHYVTYSLRHQSTNPLPTGAAVHARGAEEYSHITRDLVWGLWNDGNLFSLSTPELAYFLRVHCNMVGNDKNGEQHGASSIEDRSRTSSSNSASENQFTSDSSHGKRVDGVHNIASELKQSTARTLAGIADLSRAKKSLLVRHIEEILSAEQVDTTVAQEDNAHAVVVTEYDHVEESLDEADEYGDWGAEPGFEQKRRVDYMEINPTKLTEMYEPLAPRAYQLLHSGVASEVQLCRVNPSKLPGQRARSEAFTVSSVPADAGNRQRFQRAFRWCVANAWSLNIPAELNIGAGRVLFYSAVAKQNRSVLPKWTLQRHLYMNHPYNWFAVASESNKTAMESMVQRLQMKLIQEPTVSYRVSVRRSQDIIDCELNAQMQCVKVNRAWDRFLVAHHIRETSPDLRYVVRGRHPIKKRIADAYLEADILRGSQNSVHSILSPELGEVAYCCERVIRRWGVRTKSGPMLQLVETRRIPLIIARVGDEGERTEYEWIVSLPLKAERVDINRFSAEVWDYGSIMAKELEAGMEELMVRVMPTVASL